MNSRRSNQRRPVRRSSNSTEFDGRPDRASRNGAYTRRDSFDPSAYGRSSDSSRTPSPRSTHDDNPYTRRVSQAEYTQRRKRAKRKRIALVAVAVVLVLCLGGAGAAFAYYQTVSNNLHQGIDDDLARTLAAAEAAHPYEGGPFYMLLMGTDGSSDREASAEYAGDQFRSDSMMVTRIDPQGKKVALVSLHRDTLVDMGEYGQQKLNAAHSIGGASYTVETVSKLAGVPITHYAEINFDGFKDIVDALGGVMGLAADATYLQSRMLNKGKGPAVHALRVQTDRKRYHEYMKHALELTPGLAIHQAEIISIEVEDGHVKGVVTQLNGEYGAKCVVIATGTNLGGKIFVGDAWYASGPDGMHAANALTESLKAAGLPLRRFKTGTPARVHRRSIDFAKLECQPGDPDNELQPFSFMTDAPMHNKVECWIAYTNPETHRIILDNIQRSPLYGGMIEGVGPRYCPSIEDKVVRFAGKDRHPIFVEPCGENTEEMYLQGASSSLPEDVQNAFYRSIKGFENIEIMRPAYAIEYDCVDPTSLEATLESKVVRGLYGAGQFNGTSGYEEAAAQGLLAGLNAARNALGESQLILPRQSSYLGTLVDDLVTKGVMDPYRMMTSRSEYRLTLRQDNADTRLTPIGREYGLVQDDRWTKYQQTQAVLDAERHRLHDAHLRTADLRAAMEAAGLAPAAEGGIAEELLRRPEIDYPLIAGMIGWGEGITPMLAERLETEIKYAGYIARQDRMIHEVARHEKTLIPEDFSYTELTGLTLEAREKLARIRPKNLGQAGRIPGVSPSDVAQLSIALAAKRS